MKKIEVDKHPMAMFFEGVPVDGGTITDIKPTPRTVLDGIDDTASEIKEFVAAIRRTFEDGKVEFEEVLLVYKEAKEVVKTSFFMRLVKGIANLFKRKKK